MQSSQFSNSIRSLIKCKLNSEPVDVVLNRIAEDNSSFRFNFWFKEEAVKLKKADLKPA